MPNNCLGGAMACVSVSTGRTWVTGSITSGFKSITRKFVFFVSLLNTHVIMEKDQRLVGSKENLKGKQYIQIEK